MEELLLDPNQVGVASISVNENGPYVIAHNLTPEYLKVKGEEGVNQYLEHLAVTTIVSLGQGHRYVTGVFEFPCTSNPDLRLLILSTRIKDYTSADSRLLVGYFHFIFFIPVRQFQRMRNLVTMESELEKIISRKIIHSGEIDIDILYEVREEVVHLLRKSMQ